MDIGSMIQLIQLEDDIGIPIFSIITQGNFTTLDEF